MNFCWSQNIIFCNYSKANGKILFSFCWGNQGDANVKYVITAALYEMASMFVLFFCLPESVALHWMKVIIYLNDVGICKAWKSLIFTNHPCVFLVRAVTVPPATGHTFLNAIFRSSTYDIIQPDFTCRFLTSQVRLQQLFYLFLRVYRESWLSDVKNIKAALK